MIIAVILFSLYISGFFAEPANETSTLKASLSQGIIEEEAEIQNNDFDIASIFGGSLVSPAQASIVDFSADDEEENMDAALIQGSSLVSSAAPDLNSAFASFRKNIVTYKVVAGDIPEKIAASFNINTYTLLWANNLKETDVIKPGDELVILPINGIRIKIAEGDTIEKLAKKYNAKADEVLAFNDIKDGNNLEVDEYIIIPAGEIPTSSKVKPQPIPTAPKYAQQPTKINNWLISPTTGYNWGRLHGYNAVDIANKCGTPIYAAAAGKVILSDSVGWNGGYGKYIKIQHPNGVVTLYAHGSSLLVSAGAKVSQGQLIMYMGTTGRSTGCHLHFEVHGAKNPLAG